MVEADYYAGDGRLPTILAADWFHGCQAEYVIPSPTRLCEAVRKEFTTRLRVIHGCRHRNATKCEPSEIQSSETTNYRKTPDHGTFLQMADLAIFSYIYAVLSGM